MNEALVLIQILRYGIALGKTASEILDELQRQVDDDFTIEDYLDSLFDDLDEAQAALKAKINAQ